MKKNIVCLLLITFSFSSMALANPLREMFDEATRAYSQGNYEEAIKLYEKTIQIYPNLAPSYHYLGLTHKAMGSDLKDVAWYFKKATEINPQYTHAYDHLAKTYHALGEYDLALDSALKALEVDPSFTSAKLTLGWTYLLGKSQAQDAIFYFEDVIQDHKIPYIYFGLGIAYFLNSENYKALEMITKLRMQGEEEFATQLESLARESRYIDDIKPGTPLIFPSQGGIMQAPSDGFLSDRKGGSMEVRLKEKFPNKTPNLPWDDYSAGDLTTGNDRIRELQERSMRQDDR